MKFVLTQCGKTLGTETSASNEEYVTYSSQDQGHPTTWGHRGSSGVSWEAEGARGGHGPEPLLWFLQKRMSETGQASRSNLGLSV